MDKEMEFKNKSIKEKVNGSFEMIIVLYVVSVAFAVFLMFAVKIVPSATEYFVLAGGIVVLAIITVCSILATLKRAKMLIHYIVEPVRELSSVAEKISGGELDIEIAYQSEDEIGELAEDFRKTATTLQRIIGDLNHILDAFAKGDYTVKSGCRDAYVGEFDTVHAKLIATTEHVSDALKSIRESSNQVAQGSDQLAVSAQDLAKNATDQAVAVDSLAQSVSEITEQILGTSKSIDPEEIETSVKGIESELNIAMDDCDDDKIISSGEVTIDTENTNILVDETLTVNAEWVPMGTSRVFNINFAVKNPYGTSSAE